MRVVLTREAGRNDELSHWLGEGVSKVEVPLTSTRYLDLVDVTETLRASGLEGQFETLVVSSSRARRYLEVAVRALRKGAVVCSVGPTTTAMLEAQGVAVSAQALRSSVDLAPSITKGPVLQLGALSSRDELAGELEERGLTVVPVACYETLPLTVTKDQADELARADVVIIAAPSAWSVARDHVAPSTWVVVRGPTTAHAVRLDHERVLECWGPPLGPALAALIDR